MTPLRILIVTDAWLPQINGVVNTLQWMVRLLTMAGDTVTVLQPGAFRTLPCPTYPEIRLALASPRRVARLIEEARPDFVHIATEGPLGYWARRHCLGSSRGYTTSYHTKFPEYAAARVPVPEGLLYRMMRRFHNAGCGCMVATPSLRDELAARGFRRLMLWSRGVDLDLFRPRPGADLGLPRPVFLYVGRVAVEKNLEAFLRLDLPGTKVVVGDGPARHRLQQRFPAARFLGVRQSQSLAQVYAAADVFVFPSLTDTFGNVLLEALASGLPVAAYPVTGPKDIILDRRIGVLDRDLRQAALAALSLDRNAVRQYACGFGWEESARTFRANILTAHRSVGASASGLDGP